MKPLLAAIAALTAAQARGFDNVDSDAVPKASIAVIHELGIVVQAQAEEIAQLTEKISALENCVAELQGSPEVAGDPAGAPKRTADSPGS